MFDTPNRNEDLARLEAFAAFERRYALFDVRLAGWAPWRLLRGPIQLQVRRLPPDTSGVPAGSRLLRAVVASLRLLATLVSPPTATDLIVKTCRTALRGSHGTCARDVYFDGLLMRGMRHLKMEEVNSEAFDEPARRALFPAHFDPIAFSFLGRLLAIVAPLKGAGVVARRISDLAWQDLGLTTSSTAMGRQLSSLNWQAVLYGMLLRRTLPAAVLVSDTGEFGLILAASRLGIPVVELQHGVFNRLHRHAVPSDVHGDRAELLLPDVLACKGEFWINQLQGTRQAELCTAVGSEPIDDARSRRRNSNGRPATILFSSQGRFTDQAAEWIARMIEAAPSALDWRFVIKKHPGYDRSTTSYDFLTKDQRVVVLDGAQGGSIFELLIASDLHLSISSACLFDAAALGVRSGLLPLPTHESLAAAIDDQALTVLQNPSDAWGLLSLGPLDAADAACYSTPGFVENMEVVLRRAAPAIFNGLL